MDILQLTRALGHAIQEDERYLAFRAAKEANDQDEELQRLIGEFNLKRISINSEASKEHKDQEKLERLNAELRDCYETVMQNVHMAAYNDAKQAMDALLNEINTIIAVSANGGDPDTAQASGGCSGSCSGCSGCN